MRSRVQDGEQGPRVWEGKHARVTLKKDPGLSGMSLHLIVARNVTDPEEVKFFVRNAPRKTKVETLLWVAFARGRVERCLEDQKQEIGLDPWEGRRCVGLKRHWILSCVSYLFAARVCDQLRGGKSRANRLPSAHRRPRACEELVA